MNKEFKSILSITGTKAKKKMNAPLETGNRNEQKGKLKQKFAALTDDDQMLAEGKEEELFGKQQIRLANTQEDLMKIVSEL